MDSEEYVAHLRDILKHEDNDLSPNDEMALRFFIEREPMVQALIGTIQDHDKTDLEVMEAAEKLDRFKLK